MSQHEKPAGVRRREFLKILGATGATTAAVGCGTTGVEKLIPYVNHPDETVPGVSTYYATTCRECSVGCGLIAETRDGRTIKLEGNPAHPVNRGALCARGQAALQGLYNPDRFRGPMVRNGNRLAPATWDQAMLAFTQRLGELRSGGRAGGAVFINRHETGSFPAFLDAWLAAMGMPAHVSYDALGDAASAEAHRQAYGVAWPRFDFTAARLIVSFGADFLDGWGPSVPQQLDFADARAKIEGAPRFVYVGPRRSLTGLNADEWIPAAPGSELAIANALRGSGSLEAAAQAAGVPPATLQSLQREIAAARPALFLAGTTGPDALEVAQAVAALNAASGAAGAVIKPAEAVVGLDGGATAADMAALIQRMNAGQVTAIFLRGVNPSFTLPKSAGFAQALAKVPLKVSFSSYPDETTEMCDLVLPDNHPLESWGDAQATPSTMSLQQPTMDPVFNTRSAADVLIQAARGNPQTAGAFAQADYRSWLMARFPGGATAMARALTTAVVSGTAAAPARRPAAPAAAPATAFPTGNGQMTLVIYPSSVLGDSGANKPWLQELPDPVTKVLWQTWAEIHPSTARRLGVYNGDVLRIDGPNGLTVNAVTYEYLGIRPDTVAVVFGRGHRSAAGTAPASNGYPDGTVLTGYGRYARDVGTNPLDAMPLVLDRAGGMALSGLKVNVTKTDTHVDLVTTEGSARQHERGIGRALVLTPNGLREAPGTEKATEIAPEGGPEPGGAERAGAEPAGAAEQLPGDASHEFLPGLRAPVAQDAQGVVISDDNQKGLYARNDPLGMANRRWAMTIDLARCTGCSACVTACYAENNLPTVGAPYQQSHTAGYHGVPGANILRGREMNWIRLERYFEGAEDADRALDASFDTRFVPMLCQHCGNAPCEPVCPVYATYHSPDGLNVQVYNRCVGTRYCSNNCPYKVRYFNWFGYGEKDRPQYAWPEPLNWQLNPDVTVRQKGVMEKCTFCVQRIREAEHRAKLEGRPVRPDEFTTACAQACPSRAIQFGDAADPNWSIAKLVQDRRAYHVFEELNTYTAVVYLKKVNHPAGGAQTAAPAATTGA